MSIYITSPFVLLGSLVVDYFFATPLELERIDLDQNDWFCQRLCNLYNPRGDMKITFIECSQFQSAFVVQSAQNANIGLSRLSCVSWFQCTCSS